jgi:enoyl-CoA hydratase/carnithine racemase
MLPRMSSESVLLTVDHGAVRVLTLNRPEKKNAFDLALTDALWWGGEPARARPPVRAVVVTGAGDLFTAGADVNLFLAAANGSLGGGDVTRVGRLNEPLRACEKPVIAAVQGNAVGMGVTMLPHFDLVYASDEATFMVPFVRLGLVVEYGGSFTLPRLIGHQRTRELLLRGKPIDARTAELWGLVTRTFPRDSLLLEAVSIASDIAAQPAGAILECRRLVERGEERTLTDAIVAEGNVLASRYGSQENVEAVMAFLSRKR